MDTERAFTVLGLEPTTDGRVIRGAYVRLSRRFDPDRLNDASDDERRRAARMLTEVTEAYEALRTRRTRTKSSTSAPRTRRDRDGSVRIRPAEWASDAVDRAQQEAERAERWRRWDELEQAARTKGYRTISPTPLVPDDQRSPWRTKDIDLDAEPVAEHPRHHSLFEQRLSEARRSATRSDG